MREKEKWEGREGEGGVGIGEEEEEEERRLEEGAEESQVKWGRSSPGFAFKSVALIILTLRRPLKYSSSATRQQSTTCSQCTVNCTRIHNLKLVQCSSNTSLFTYMYRE